MLPLQLQFFFNECQATYFSMCACLTHMLVDMMGRKIIYCGTLSRACLLIHHFQHLLRQLPQLVIKHANLCIHSSQARVRISDNC